MLAFCITVTASETTKPNIIVILTDDLGWGDLSCYPKGAAWGDEAFVATPHLDRLAASGARFTDAYATCMVCSPSRAALLSGRYQQRFGWFGFVESNAGIPAGIKLLPQAMREAGYSTGMVGKWHVGYPRGFTPLDRGVDHFFGFLGGQHDYFKPNLGQPTEGVANAPDAWILDQDEPAKKVAYLTDEFTDRALEFVRGAHAARRPFFLYLAYNTPHPPMQSPWKDLEPFAKQRPQERFNSRDIARAMIVRLDENIARLTAWLRESGIAENTLVIFTSDNGGADDGPGHVTQHNGGLRGRKGYFYEGGIRVPFLVSWPGHVPAGLVYRQPVSHLDIYPTLLAAAGVPPGDQPPQLDGVNLLPFLTGERTGAPHARLFWSLENRQVKWAVREGRWKLVNDDVVPTIKQSESKPEFHTQLFDLETDPFEEHDLASSEPERTAALKRAMAEFHATMKPTISTAAVKAAHEAQLTERENDPALRSLPRVDGAPGHWIGAGAEQRFAAEAAKKNAAAAPAKEPRDDLTPAKAHGTAAPDIIVILADDLGWGDLSCYPQDTTRPGAVTRTPNIDRLAAEGVRCTQGYATCCVCTPSRAGLLTGRYQQTLGFFEFVEAQVGLPRNVTTLPQFLKLRGYTSACIGKWHLGYVPERGPLRYGFDRFFGFLGGQHDYFDKDLGDSTTGMSFDHDPFSCVRDQDEPVKEMEYLTDELTKRAIEFIEQQASACRPFFLYLPYSAPHPPMQSTWEKLAPYAAARGGKFTSRDIARAMIDSLDEGIGRVLARLAELGLERDTLVFLSSDNGGHDDGPPHEPVQHNGGLRPRKGFLWEGGIRVPFLVRWPACLPKGVVYDKPVSHLDVFATIAANTGVPPGARPQLDGVDLIPYLRGDNPNPPHETLFWGFHEQANRWAVRKGDWKLAHDFVDGEATRTRPPKLETGLYDLKADPRESRNLAGEHLEVVKELLALKDGFYQRCPPSIATPEVREAWQADLERRKAKLPNPDALRRDGAPGHWLK